MNSPLQKILSPKATLSNIWVPCQSFRESIKQDTFTVKAEISNTLEPFVSIYGQGSLRLLDQKIIFQKGGSSVAFLQLNDQITYLTVMDEETRQCYFQLNKHFKQSYLFVDYDSKDVVDEYLKQYIFKLDFYNQYSLTKAHSQDQNVKITQVQRKTDGTLFISKSYQKSKINTCQQEKKQFMNEIKMLRKLNHKYIISGTDYYESDNTYKLIISNYEGKTLNQKIREIQSLTLQEICVIIEQILQGLKYLHSNDIMVRTLDLDSIQFKYNNSYNLLITNVRDYQVIGEEIVHIDAQQNGFVAPEVIFTQNERDYNTKCDIYSCGAIFYRLTVGNSCQQSIKDQQACKYCFTSDEFKLLPPQVQSLIKQMLENSPEKRPTADEAINRLSNLLNEEERKLICAFKPEETIKRLTRCKTIDSNPFHTDVSPSSPVNLLNTSQTSSTTTTNKAVARFINMTMRKSLTKSNSFNLNDSIDHKIKTDRVHGITPKSSYSPLSSKSSPKKLNFTESLGLGEAKSPSSLFKKIKNSSFFTQIK